MFFLFGSNWVNYTFFLRVWEVLVHTNFFSIDEFSEIVLMCKSVIFLIVPSIPPNTGIIPDVYI